MASVDVRRIKGELLLSHLQARNPKWIMVDRDQFPDYGLNDIGQSFLFLQPGMYHIAVIGFNYRGYAYAQIWSKLEKHWRPGIIHGTHLDVIKLRRGLDCDDLKKLASDLDRPVVKMLKKPEVFKQMSGIYNSNLRTQLGVAKIGEFVSSESMTVSSSYSGIEIRIMDDGFRFTLEKNGKIQIAIQTRPKPTNGNVVPLIQGLADDVGEFIRRDYNIRNVEQHLQKSYAKAAIVVSTKKTPDQFPEMWEFIKETTLGRAAIQEYTVKKMRKQGG